MDGISIFHILPKWSREIYRKARTKEMARWVKWSSWSVIKVACSLNRLSSDGEEESSINLIFNLVLANELHSIYVFLIYIKKKINTFACMLIYLSSVLGIARRIDPWEDHNQVSPVRCQKSSSPQTWALATNCCCCGEIHVRFLLGVKGTGVISLFIST